MDGFTLAFDDRIATLTIDRPKRRNAVSYEMWSALPALMAEVTDRGARVLVVRGAGEHFSAGADITEFGTLRNGADGAMRYAEAVHAGERALAELPVPTIAAVAGVCVGGGCELALACDIRVAADDARFGITPAKLGIVYHFTSTRRLVDAVGPAWAKQILFGADLYDAATALRIGLVNELTSGSPFERVAVLATTIASRAQVTLRGAKQIVNGITAGQDDEDDAVRALYTEAAVSAEYAEGVTAFLEKRPPQF